MSNKYVDYKGALKTCSMLPLEERRQIKMDKFIIKATKHEKHKTMFPISNNFLNNHHNLRNPEKFVVNSANTQAYKNSFIPYAQRRLNQLHYDGKL